MIRLIALDVDGTLLDGRSQLSPRNKEALRRAGARGTQVVLATGRTRPGTAALIESLGLTGPGIFIQGLAICDHAGAVTWERTLDADVCRDAIAAAEARGLIVLANVGMGIVGRMVTDRIREAMVRHHERPPEAIPSWDGVPGTAHKLMVLGMPSVIEELKRDAPAILGGRARAVSAGLPHLVEIVPSGSSKGAALEVVLGELGVGREEVLAVGDAENDIEMLRLAGVGVAMGQAPREVKDAARFVVADNDADGVAEALERYAG